MDGFSGLTTETLRLPGEPGGDRGKADNSTVDGATNMAAGGCDGSNLQRVYLREVLPATRRPDRRRALLADRQVSGVADAASLSHRSRPSTHH